MPHPSVILSAVRASVAREGKSKDPEGLSRHHTDSGNSLNDLSVPRMLLAASGPRPTKIIPRETLCFTTLQVRSAKQRYPHWQ